MEQNAEQSKYRAEAIRLSKQDKREGVVYRLLSFPAHVGKFSADQHFVGHPEPDFYARLGGIVVVETYIGGKKVA